MLNLHGGNLNFNGDDDDPMAEPDMDDDNNESKEGDEDENDGGESDDDVV